MLKLLWSWVLLIVLASLTLLYQPEILTAKIELTVAGAQYAVHAWFILFLVVLLIITVLTLSNLMFFWQRRLLIRKCKQLTNGIRALASFIFEFATIKEEKQLLKLAKALPLPKSYKTKLQKALLKEADSDGSLLTLWWHGHWQRFSELICYGPINSTWLMQACSHIFLLGGFQKDMLPSFMRAWEQHGLRMLQLYPTVALAVQIRLFEHYDLVKMQAVWEHLPKKNRKDNALCLAYVQALARYQAFPQIQLIIEEYLAKGWNKFLGEWYFKTMPRSELKIEQLQKWLKQAPTYLTNDILFALARAYAAKGEWQTTQSLIERLQAPELTYALELELYAKQGNLAQLMQLIDSDRFGDRAA